MKDNQFSGLTAFAAIADQGSFVGASRVLGITTPSVSAALRGLEERLGVRLFNRTTRAVTLTEAGAALLAQVRPALEQLQGAAEVANRFREKPGGTLRLAANSLAAESVILPVISDFMRHYPSIKLDITFIDGPTDIVAGGFDAGIGAGKLIAEDMIAVRVSPDSRLVPMASPKYIERFGEPRTLADLQGHNCVRWRMPNGAIYPWRFMVEGKSVEVEVGGSLVTNNIQLMASMVARGACIALGIESVAKRQIDQGLVVAMLQKFARPWSGWHVYYASRSQLPMSLRSFIDFMRNHPAVA